MSFLGYCFVHAENNAITVDTLSFSNDKIIVGLPMANIHKIDTYEEGTFHFFNCFLDSCYIIIHSGSMVSLPLTKISERSIISEFTLNKDVRVLRGFHFIDSNHIKKLYFREENYFKYGITVLYENVEESKLSFYNGLFDNIKVYRIDAK
jgi:hypothetical protein